MSRSIILSDRQQEIYHKYANISLSGYVVYPDPSLWSRTSTIAEIKEQLDETVREQKSLSLAFHVPFAAENASAMAAPRPVLSSQQVEEYLRGLEHECARLAHHLDNCVIEQVHLGNPAHHGLATRHWRQLNENILSRFTISEESDWTVQMDAQSASEELLGYLREIGINRVGFRLQEFKTHSGDQVIPSFEVVKQAVTLCRRVGIPFINFDLYYGYAGQSLVVLQGFLNQIISLNPDRIAYYPHNQIGAQTGLDLRLAGLNRFIEAGYAAIGLDHFAKQNDALTQAARQDRLQRTQQGLDVGASLPLLGFGPGAISIFDSLYVQNPSEVSAWMQMLENHEFTCRSQLLNDDDKLRRDVINQIFTQGTIDKTYTESLFDIEFDSYFAGELQRLKILAADGLVQLETYDIRLTKPLGLLLRSAVAAVFDVYLPKTALPSGLSRP